MKPRLPLLIATALSALLSVSTGPLIYAPPAAAVEFWNIYDGPPDTGGGYDTEVTYLSTSKPGYLVIRIDGHEFTRDRLNIARAQLDTARRNAGPEFRVTWMLPHDNDGISGVLLERVDTWGGPGRLRDCPDLDRTVDYGRDIVRLLIPRKCVGRPGKVRWNVMTGRISEYRDDTILGDFDNTPDSGLFIRGFWVG